MSVFESVSEEPPYDFRSARFCADVQMLVRTTGRSLEACRQDLFIAEGDLALAFEWLVCGYQACPADPVIH